MEIISRRVYRSDFDVCSETKIENSNEQWRTLEPYLADGSRPIPEGRYRLSLVTSPHFTPLYGHQMIMLNDVPGHDHVLIHKGNTFRDTLNCQLVGSRIEYNSRTGEYLHDSKLTYDHIYPIISSAIQSGEEVWYTVKNDYPLVVA